MWIRSSDIVGERSVQHRAEPFPMHHLRDLHQRIAETVKLREPFFQIKKTRGPHRALLFPTLLDIPTDESRNQAILRASLKFTFPSSQPLANFSRLKSMMP